MQGDDKARNDGTSVVVGRSNAAQHRFCTHDCVGVETHPNMVHADERVPPGWQLATFRVARGDAHNLWPAVTPRDQGLELQGSWDDHRHFCMLRGDEPNRRWAAIDEAAFPMLPAHRQKPVEPVQGQESLAAHLLAVPDKDSGALRVVVFLEDDWCMQVL